MFRIGIDLGGTKIEAIVLDEEAIRLRQGFDVTSLFRKRVETQQEKGYAHILNRIKGLYDELVAGISGRAAYVRYRHARGHFSATGLLKKFQHALHERPAVESGPRTDSRREIEIQNDGQLLRDGRGAVWRKQGPEAGLRRGRREISSPSPGHRSS